MTDAVLEQSARLQLDGVPEAISREAYLQLIETLGLEVTDLRSLRFEHKAIVAEVRARHPEHGGAFAIGDELAVHTVVIPVVEHAEPVRPRG